MSEMCPSFEQKLLAAKISSCLDTVSSFHGTACKCLILEMGLIVAICSPIVILDTPHSKNITETAINADTSIKLGKSNAVKANRPGKP